MLPKKLVFVDLETTGASATHGRIIEIGMLKVENGTLIDTFSSLINPQTYIPPEIEKLTGISQHDIEDAPTFDSLAKDIHIFLKDFIFVAHNVRFDYSFLKYEFARSEMPFTSRHFCTVRLSRLLYPRHKRHNLDSIIERFNLSCKSRHRAFDDAVVIKEFYDMAQKAFPKDAFEKAVAVALKKPSLPPRLKGTSLKTLPENSGVYIMYGKEGIPLYVGKSVNIKDRVLSHFASDIRSPFEMKIAQQVESIETRATAGELGALILESSLIKKMLPLYNKKLRIKRELTVIRNIKTKDGYESIVIEPVEKIYPTDLQDDAKEKILGLFKSKKQAKNFLCTIAKEYNLCEKLLLIENTNTACFAHRLGTCKGACIKEELPIRYNMRFVEAFSKSKIKPWPFQGPIVIKEKNFLTGDMQYFFLDKWCYLGSILTDSKGSVNKNVEQDVTFDSDIYKILLSYLKTPKYLKNIHQLQNSIDQVWSSEDFSNSNTI